MKSLLFRTRRSAQHSFTSSVVSGLARNRSLASSKASYVWLPPLAHLVRLRQNANGVRAQNEVLHADHATQRKAQVVVVSLRSQPTRSDTSRQRLRAFFWLKGFTSVVSVFTCLNA